MRSWTMEDLVDIVARLRGPDGCPWDKEQNQKSLAPFAIEEAHELAEALASGDQKAIQEELGDFLFQVILQAQVARDENLFTLPDVLKVICEKMIERHPHVFASSGPSLTTTEVLKNWDLQKRKKESSKSLFNYPATLPTLIVSHKIGVKSYAWGFDWENTNQVVDKVNEELSEVLQVLNDPEEAFREIGDLLFTVAQLARHLKIDPDQSLREANLRLQKRFTSMIEMSGCGQEDFARLSPAEKEAWWEKAKRLEKQP